MRTSISAVAALTLAATLTLSACGTTGAGSATGSGTVTSTSSSTSAPDSAGALVLKDGWVKATGEKMTGVFGTLENTTDEAIHLTTGSTSAAGMLQMHITVKENGAMVMKQSADGFTIEPGSTFELKPGGNHIMLMALSTTIKAGDPLNFTVTDADGTDYDLTAVGREFAGAQETYAPEKEGTMGSSSMSSSTDHS